MPRATCSMSAPTFSHRSASWLTKAMRVARKVLAAYLMISAASQEVTSSGTFFEVSGR